MRPTKVTVRRSRPTAEQRAQTAATLRQLANIIEKAPSLIQQRPAPDLLAAVFRFAALADRPGPAAGATVVSAR